METAPIEPLPNVFVTSLMWSNQRLQLTGDAHPVVDGVSDFALITGDYVELPVSGVQGDAVVLATSGPSGLPSVAARDVGAGHSAYLGPIYTGQDSYNNDELRTGAADRLLGDRGLANSGLPRRAK